MRKTILHHHAESYSQRAAGSREMTLRITLTRLDLRVNEDSIYLWHDGRSKSPLLSGAESLDDMSEQASLLMRDRFRGRVRRG